MAAKARLPEKFVPDTADKIVAHFQDVWRKEKNNLDLTSDMIEAINKHLKTIPIADEGR